jgi:hypothetical protein
MSLNGNGAVQDEHKQKDTERDRNALERGRNEETNAAVLGAVPLVHGLLDGWAQYAVELAYFADSRQRRYTVPAMGGLTSYSFLANWTSPKDVPKGEDEHKEAGTACES